MRLTSETSPLPRLLVFPSLVLAASVMAVARWRAGWLLAAAWCPWREATGWSCPTCGATHAVVALAQGRWSAALRAHPLLVVATGFCVLWAIQATAATLQPRWRYRLELSPSEKKAVRWSAALILILSWVYQATGPILFDPF